MSLMWKEAKKKMDAWKHIKVTLSGEKDLAICTICEKEVELNDTKRPKQSIYLKFSRIHFYKHKLNENYEQKN